MAIVKKIIVLYDDGSEEKIGEQNNQMDTLIDAQNWIMEAINGQQPGEVKTTFEIELPEKDYIGALKIVSDQMLEGKISIGDASLILSNAYGIPEKQTMQDIKDFRIERGVPIGCPLHTTDPGKAIKDQKLERLIPDCME